MQSLINLLEECLVRITPSDKIGAGFFVAPRLILTCAHLVDNIQIGEHVSIFWHKKEEFKAQLMKVCPPPYPDLALLGVEGIPEDHPCVFFDNETHVGDSLYSIGFPQGYPNGSPSTFALEGNTGGPDLLLTFKEGEVRPGFSGSPLLNLHSGGICGMIRLTRGEGTLMGGRAIPVSTILEHFPELAEEQRRFHADDQRWSQACAEYFAGRSEEILKSIIHQQSAEPETNLEEAEATYRQKVVEAYQRMDFGGFAHPDVSLIDVPLEKIFVRLTVEKVIREPRHEGGQRERVIPVQEPIGLDKALSNNSLIVGEPGAGKSTLLRWLAVTFARRRQRDLDRVGPSADAERLPVLVELGRLPGCYLQSEGGEIPNWFQLLPEYLARQTAFSQTPSQLLTQALTEGHCLLLFDGLDEVAHRQTRIRLIQSFVELARHFPGNRVIIGSRPSGVSIIEGTLYPQFQRYQIKRFAPEDVQRFFSFWYSLPHEWTPKQQRDGADALYATVQATPGILELAQTPLLCTLLLLTWLANGTLPERRIELYEQCCCQLIEHWEAHHNVTYLGKESEELASLGWDRHLELLEPVAYHIHTEEQQTSASGKDVRQMLAEGLVKIRACTKEFAGAKADRFLRMVGLRSGLLQDLGDDRYGFPHQTFQEYLAARYIAAQPYPEYIDLVMVHLHEAWWYEVHLLTMAHLGSGRSGAKKASALVLAILYVYKPPCWILRPPPLPWLHWIEPGKLLPQLQLERRIAWILAREFELAIKGYAECVPNGTTATVAAALSTQATSLVRRMFRGGARLRQVTNSDPLSGPLNALLEALHDKGPAIRKAVAKSAGLVGISDWKTVSEQLKPVLDDFDITPAYIEKMLEELQIEEREDPARELEERLRKESGLPLVDPEVVPPPRLSQMRARLENMRHQDFWMRRQAARDLGRMGVADEAELSILLTALRDVDPGVREGIVESLGRLHIKDTAQLREVLIALNRCLYDRHRISNGRGVREAALIAIRQLLDGRPIPGYRWVPWRKQQVRHITFRLVLALICLITVLLVGRLSPLTRCFMVFVSMFVFIIAVSQVQRWMQLHLLDRKLL